MDICIIQDSQHSERLSYKSQGDSILEFLMKCETAGNLFRVSWLPEQEAILVRP